MSLPARASALPARGGRAVSSDLASGSRVPPTLIAAYRATHYCVNGVSLPFLLRVDDANEALAACHLSHGVSCSAFLTAWNPGSRATPDDQNEAEQTRLQAVLRERGFALIAGLGLDPTGQWGV